MAKFANAIPRLNTEAINSGALAAARLQGEAQGSQQSGVDRALRSGVSALRERQEAVTREVERQKLVSQIKINEQRQIQSAILFDTQKEQANLQTQKLRFERDALARQSERSEQFNRNLGIISGTPNNEQEIAAKIRVSSSNALITPETKEEQAHKAMGQQALGDVLNIRMNIKGLGRHRLGTSEDRTRREFLTILGQSRDPILRAHARSEGLRLGMSEAEVDANIALGRDLIQRGLIDDLPQRLGEQDLTLMGGAPLTAPERNQLLQGLRSADAQLQAIRDDITLDETQQAQRSVALEHSRNQISAALTRANVATGVGFDDEGGTSFDALLQDNEVAQPAAPTPPALDEAQPDTSVTDRRLSAQLTEAKERLQELPPGRDRAAAARRINQLESRIQSLPTDIQRVEQRLEETRERLETATGRQRVSLGPVISRLEDELLGLRQDRVSLQEAVLAGEPADVST